MKYIVANLKSNNDLNTMLKYNDELHHFPNLPINLIVCPSYPFLSISTPGNYYLGAQNISRYEAGSYTGEVNGQQLKSLGVSYVIIGHSERRKLFLENEETIVQKMNNAFSNDIKVILCVGEDILDYQTQNTSKILEQQIATVLNEFNRDQIKNVIIAYEPIWSIGTGITPSIDNLKSNIEFIKKIINDYYELELPVIYGGSINQNNINYIKSISCLDGFIIGESAINIQEFKYLLDTYLS